MNEYRADPRSITGKALHVAEHTQLLVVGAGPAGLAAAMEGVRRGLAVVLADENPVPAETMGLDIPLHFGGRVGGAARNRNAMTEAVLASDPGIVAAFEAGVDVRLGTVVWGLFGNNASMGWLPGLVAGLTQSGQEHGQSMMLRADRVVVAAGRRDMGLAFPGWELPGVLGIGAALHLAHRYGALDVHRAVVLGTTAETLAACAALRDAGVEIAAIMEQAATPAHPGVSAGIEVLSSHVVRRALGGAGGVEAVIVASIGPDGSAIPGTDRTIACDAVLLGIGAVPAIELLDALGCRMAFQPERGGFAPVLDAAQQTTVPGVYAAGDCAGIWPSKTAARAVAEAEGRRAVAAVPDSAAAPDAPAFDLSAYRLGWVRASVIGAGVPDVEAEPHVCQCEEVTAREILEVRPPRYLGWPDDRRNARDLHLLLGDGPPNPDQVKRLTRAGMGLCQGRRCREQIAALLALGAGVPLSDVPLATHRAPVRPLPLVAAADTAEPAAMTEQWDTWFGMVSQYLPPWEVPTHYTAAGRDGDVEVASE